MSSDTFLGYRRPDGRVGVRNHVVVIPSCGCALHVAAQICAKVGDTVLVGYDEGCGATQHDIEQITNEQSKRSTRFVINAGEFLMNLPVPVITALFTGVCSRFGLFADLAG